MLLVVARGKLLHFDNLQHEVGALGLRALFCRHDFPYTVLRKTSNRGLDERAHGLLLFVFGRRGALVGGDMVSVYSIHLAVRGCLHNAVLNLYIADFYQLLIIKTHEISL